MAQPPIVNLITSAARQRGVDPQAALAVARQEGLSGAVGDHGTSFGPFQLHYGGAYPASAPHGPGSQAWAMSPAGVGYALDQINHVAHGEHGAQAIRDIVSRFERPANPAREIANALAAYGGQEGYAGTPPGKIAYGQTPPGRMLVGGTPPQDNRRQLLLALANSVGEKSPDYTPLLTQLLARREAPQAAPVSTAPSVPQGLRGQFDSAPITGGYRGGPGQIVGNTQGENAGFLNDLKQLAGYEHAPVQINSGYRSAADQARLYANRANNPNPVAPPGHSLHEQGLAADGTVGGRPLGTLPPAVLAMFGLETVPGDPVHVQVRRR